MMGNRRVDPTSFGSVSTETRSSKVLKASFNGAKIECRSSFEMVRFLYQALMKLRFCAFWY